jgi:uncharacterized RDD family membrane protein YckC
LISVQADIWHNIAVTNPIPPIGPARGWYPDPAQSGHERYWDGQQWTHVVRRAEQIEPTPWARGKIDRPMATVKDPALDLPVAGWWRRFGSGVIDTVIGWVLTGLIVAIVAPGYWARLQSLFIDYSNEVQALMLAGDNPFISAPGPLTVAVSNLMMAGGAVMLVSTVVFMGTWGATIGQRLCGLTVVRAPLPMAVLTARPDLKYTPDKPGWMRAISKGIAWSLLSAGGSIFMIIQLVNALMPLWQRRHQSVTDLLASTIVIRQTKTIGQPDSTV